MSNRESLAKGIDRYYEFFERIRHIPREALVPFYIAAACFIEWIGFHVDQATETIYYGWLNEPQVAFD